MTTSSHTVIVINITEGSSSPLTPSYMPLGNGSRNCDHFDKQSRLVVDSYCIHLTHYYPLSIEVIDEVCRSDGNAYTTLLSNTYL